jgi:hypothetical protein
MVNSDLIVLLPWPASGAALTLIFLLLLRKSGGPPSPPGPRQPGPDETPGAAAGRTADRARSSGS